MVILFNLIYPRWHVTRTFPYGMFTWVSEHTDRKIWNSLTSLMQMYMNTFGLLPNITNCVKSKKNSWYLKCKIVYYCFLSWWMLYYFLLPSGNARLHISLLYLHIRNKTKVTVDFCHCHWRGHGVMANVIFLQCFTFITWEL